MKAHRTLLAVALIGGALRAEAQGPMSVAPSGRATTEVSLTLVDSIARAATKPSVIRIDYGVPHLRGRKLGTDSLVPYDKPWRTGANGATTLSTDVDLVLGGAAVPKGKYVLTTLPARDGWTLVVQTDASPAREVARIPLRVGALPNALESLSMWLIPSTDQGRGPRGELRIAWGTVALATDWAMKP